MTVSQPPSPSAPQNANQNTAPDGHLEASAAANELTGDLNQDPVLQPKKKALDAIKTAFKIVFAAALLYWLYKKGVLDVASLKAVATPGLVLFFLAIVGCQIFVNNYRWLALMRAQNFESTVGKTLPLSLIGVFFNFAMPGGVGGDVVKGFYLLKQHPQQKFAAAVSIFMDRLIGFFIMIATAFFALFLDFNEVASSPQLKSVAFGVTALFAAFIVFFAISFSPIRADFFYKLPAGRKIHALYEVLHSYRHNPKALAIAVLMSVFNQLLMIALVTVIGAQLGEQIPLSIYFFLVPIGVVAQAIPISPAGIGVGQAALLFLFRLHLHRDSPVGPVSITATQIASLAWGLVGAFFYLRMSHAKPKT